MPTLLQQLYNGDLSPSEQCPYTPAQRAQRNRFFDLCEAFQKSLEQSSPALAAQFNAISDESLTTACIDGEAMFLHGFCMGAKLMLEILHTPCGPAGGAQ